MKPRKTQRWEEMDKSTVPLETLFANYALYNRSEGKSPSTISWYNDKLNDLLRWLREKEYPTDLGGFSVERVRQFVLYQQERENKYERNTFVPTQAEKLSGHTIRGYVRTLKAFSSWLWNEGYTDTNILGRYRLPKARQTEPEWLTQDEIERLLKGFDRNSTLGARDYAIVLTFLDTGLRCSELCNLVLPDADLQMGQLKVLGKGNRERLVPVGARATRALRRYRDHFRPPVDDERFFLTVDGRPLTVRAIQLMIRRAKARADIPRLHVHLLRHTFAVHYLMAGGDVFSLQRILGHSTLEVTRIYVNLVASQVKEKHRLFSPMDNMALPTERVGSKPVAPGTRLWRLPGSSNGRRNGRGRVLVGR
ncbi:MAG: tyrosine-type recombinase/integrase [Dehalococcoidia bacterium]|nr:tyrosine-type recombinase/integrase [Dehalococcoidia bacterium]